MSVTGCIGDFGEEEIGGKETWMLRRNVKRAPTAHKQPPAEFVTILLFQIMKINFKILLCKNMQDAIIRHTIKHKYRHKMMNVKHETDLATYKGHLVLFIRAISISALIVLMSKEPGQISMCKYQ